MGQKNKSKTTQWAIVGLVLAVVALGFISFNLSGTDAETAPGTPVAPSVQCDKSFEKDITLVSRNAYEKGSAVDTSGTVSYSVWKIVDDEVRIPQDDIAEGADLTVGYLETFEVVATSNGSDVIEEYETFEVDAQCTGPTDTVFYMTAVPASLDARFDSSKIDGANAVGNEIPIPQEGARTVTGTWNGDANTAMDAVIVFNADEDIIADIDSSLASTPEPEAHSTALNEQAYAFKLGMFDENKDVEANFDFVAEDTATLGDYNVTYTIYSYQTGYVDSDTGEYVLGDAIEDNDENVLLPTYTGELYLEITA